MTILNIDLRSEVIDASSVNSNTFLKVAIFQSNLRFKHECISAICKCIRDLNRVVKV